MRSQTPGEHERECVVGEARVDAVDEDGDARLFRRRDERRGQGSSGAGYWQHHRARGHHVDAGGQEALQVRHGLEDAVVGHGGVHDAVGLRAPAARRRRWCRPRRSVLAEPGQLAGVAAHLVGVRHEEPDQLELGMGVDAGQGVAPDVAGAPLHDAVTP